MSVLSDAQADKVQAGLRARGKTFAAQRSGQYLARRRQIEAQIRTIFLEKGGRPQSQTPHYMVLGECPWLLSWYEEGAFLKTPLEALDQSAVSFTYGDSFPTFSPQLADGRPYRGQGYTLA